ncbi:MAG TPA: hypothetical protein VGC07_10580 [Granulicella sp.]
MLPRLLLALLLLTPVLTAQRDGSYLSEAEVDQLRDAAYTPNERVLVFVKFLDERSEKIQKLSAGPRRAGREEDIHNLLEQFTSIVNELEDNLDEYGPAHRDIRKSLPKLLTAIDRWATVIRTPPDNQAYNVSRKLALESLGDLHEDAAQLTEEQKAWFLAHPPAKEDKEKKSSAEGP